MFQGRHRPILGEHRHQQYRGEVMQPGAIYSGVVSPSLPGSLALEGFMAIAVRTSRMCEWSAQQWRHERKWCGRRWPRVTAYSPGSVVSWPLALRCYSHKVAISPFWFLLHNLSRLWGSSFFSLLWGRWGWITSEYQMSCWGFSG